MRLRIAPSILSADFSCLGEQVREVVESGADQIHVDVMDGHFVPNLSMGTIVVEALRRVTDCPLDVHLMITDPHRYSRSFADAGASHITFHIEVDTDHRQLCDTLRDWGVGCGIAVSPQTPIEVVEALLPHIDLLLVMTVHPGFGGQSFLAENLEKVRWARRHIDDLATREGRSGPSIQVDGGVDSKTAIACRDAGADNFVAGSAIFRARDPGEALRDLRRRLEAGRGELSVSS